MPDAAPAPGTPEAYLLNLSKALDARAPTLKLWDDYYEGRHRLAFATSKFRETFGSLFSAFSVNWCELVVDAVEERLNVEGFRMGASLGADADAWRIWQANQLDAESQVAHVEALVKSEAYYLVSPFASEWPADDVPLITIESPDEMIVLHAPGNRRRRVAALKRWREDGRWLATLYTPDGIYKWRSKGAVAPDAAAAVPREMSGWERREVDGEDWPLANPIGVVPVVPLSNRRRLTAPARSEIANVIAPQDAINKLVADMIVASEFSAFRQRWATGVEIPVDPDTGKPIEPFKNAAGKVWVANPPDAHPDWRPSFGEFGQTDLGVYVKAIEMLVHFVASTTRTPPHYFLGQSGTFPSGESIKSAETGLVSKARRKMRHLGEGHEEAILLAFLALGDERAAAIDAETIWADPEYRTEGEHVDALLKLRTLGIPDDQLWEDAGYSPQQIARFKAMRAALALEMGTTFDPFRAESPEQLAAQALAAAQASIAAAPAA